METIDLPHLPEHQLHVCLFEDVKNAAFLRRQLLEGNTDFEYAFLDASVLLSRNHVLAACFRAILDLTNSRLKSRNVHSEIVFALSPNNNIAESFRRFGISDDSRNIVAIKVNGDPAKIESHLKQNVEGNTVPFSDEQLDQMCDHSRVRKIYKTNDLSNIGTDAATKKDAEAFILGSMALKGS